MLRNVFEILKSIALFGIKLFISNGILGVRINFNMFGITINIAFKWFELIPMRSE